MSRDLDAGTNPQTGKEFKPAARKKMELKLATKANKISRMETKLATLRAEHERRLAAVKELEEAEAALKTTQTNERWTESQRLRLIELVHSEAVQKAFQNTVDTSDKVWADVGNTLNNDRPEGHPERPANAYKRQYKDMRAHYKLYLNAQDSAMQSGASGDAPAEIAMPHVLRMGGEHVLHALEKAGLHREADVLPEWRMDTFCMQRGGRAFNIRSTPGGASESTAGASESDVADAEADTPGKMPFYGPYERGYAGKGQPTHCRPRKPCKRGVGSQARQLLDAQASARSQRDADRKAERAERQAQLSGAVNANNALRDKMIEQGDDMRRQLAAMVQANKALADGFQGMAQAQERQHQNFLRGLEGQNKALIEGLQGLATALAGRR